MTPTPVYVLDAIDTIVGYLRQGGWCEAIISDTGGASFRLDSIYPRLFPRSGPTPLASDAADGAPEAYSLGGIGGQNEVRTAKNI